MGKNVYIKQNGQFLNLGGKNLFRAEPGDRIRIETPGGGGFGTNEQKI
jgi:N-methylhydantoinase B/oxoprolinase/acetone carboxylase alpha subunit